MDQILKYPRTAHIEGSRLQPGDEDLSATPLSDLAGERLVFEEKLDGANAGISFSPAGELLLQSRGHYLKGGRRERHFHLFKTWAQTHRAALHKLLGSRFVVYGEWLYAKHTIFYDRLPHYFMEFDVFDRENQAFLSTKLRQDLFAGTPIVSAPVLWAGATPRPVTLAKLVRKSLYKSDRWADRLASTARAHKLDVERVQRETDLADEMEGLYIKAERDGRVVGRYKYVRAGFLDSVQDSGGHWLDRPIVPNQLADGVDIFSPSPGAAP